MRIACIGGGPAGLYFALLVKKARPSWEVRVFERNAPGVTFGWGVVFSDETLGNFETADRESFERISKAFAYWSDIDVWVGDRNVRSTGHGFAGLARRELLAILEGRCAELGVTVEHGRELDDDALAGFDLVVAADGVNSKTREKHASIFRTETDLRRCRYIWLGTDRLFDAFTFFFEKNEHGVFQVHAYRFDESRSTFIVECDEASYEAAGLGHDLDADLRYLERLFARGLQGGKLFENRASWIRFPTVTNATWRAGNVVLLGDAAHTAHFSIGSGTKLAMEDSIALADAVLAHAPDVHHALEVYEAARRPVVERTQRVAQHSLEWFETTRRYVDLEPLELAFSLLSRSKQITWENLRRRDPALVDRLARSFQARTELGAPRDGEPPRPPLFTPLSLRGLRLENRVVVSPMCMYSAHEGVVGDFHLVHYGARALGGAGLVMTEMTDVARDARISPGCAGLWNDEQAAAWKRIVDFVHGQSASKIGVQLAHAGRKGSTRRMWEGMDQPLAEDNWALEAPSPLPYLPASQVPRAMTTDDLARVRADFVAAARRAAETGFDLLELHFGHGYLLASFLSPLTNHRTDAYGGSREGRMRFPLEVLEAVRAAWPAERPLSVRISATDWAPGGFEGDDAVALALALKERGVDLVDVSTGQTVPDQKPVFGRMWQAKWSDWVRREAGIRTMAVGNIQDADQVNTILAAGRADLCAIGRPHLADPAFTWRAAKELGYGGLAWPPQYGVVRPG